MTDGGLWLTPDDVSALRRWGAAWAERFIDPATREVAMGVMARDLGELDTFRNGESALASTLAGHYFSTYCLHDDHGHCRLTCKFCSEACRCSCHGTPP